MLRPFTPPDFCPIRAGQPRGIVFDFFSGLNGWTSGFPDDWLIVSVDVKAFQIVRENHIHLAMSILDHRLLPELKAILSWFNRSSPDLILASPPCECFSIASCSTHWTPPPNRRPKTNRAIAALTLVARVRQLIDCFNCPWVIENPRGLMRKTAMRDRNPIMQTIWLCRYGDDRGKPTDLWSNMFDGWQSGQAAWEPRPECANHRFDRQGRIINRQCHHEQARRGAKTGTQGRTGRAARSLLPVDLSTEVHGIVSGLMEGG